MPYARREPRIDGMDYRRLLTPTIFCRGSVVDVDLQSLLARGVRGLILDFDDTLLVMGAPRLDPEVSAWVTRAKLLFQVWIVSNNPNRRFIEEMVQLLELQVVSGANKPSRRAIRKVLEKMQLEPSQVAIIGDRVFTDVLVGNRLGSVTILVAPPGPSQVFWSRGLVRKFERMLLGTT